jgi:energy-coupling factor transporter ATP-binding protein EcfA2
MFDEPLLRLAPNIVERMFDIIRQIRAEGVTVIMVEQNAAPALELSDRSYVLEQGRVTITGTGEALCNDPRAFLGAPARRAVIRIDAEPEEITRKRNLQQSCAIDRSSVREYSSPGNDKRGP